ncbi:MAG TPA: hypothetical protein VKA08_07320 [Balneolales bacterium]|nr:hypothetical protein [Balneolales bacterium]
MAAYIYQPEQVIYMISEFSKEQLELIGKTLGASFKKVGNLYRIELRDEPSSRKLAIELHLDLDANGRKMNMVSAYAHETFLQLHNCIGFVASQLLNQVTFFGKQNGYVSGLIVEKEAGCSLYANVDEALITGDFTNLPPELMMGSVALSLTESIDFEGFSFDDE